MAALTAPPLLRAELYASRVFPPKLIEEADMAPP